MARTPITQAQWREVMGSDPSYFKGEDLPVESVSWRDAQEFCKKTRTRLPKEAEWEYAYRAGTNTTWYNGDDESKVGEIAWFSGNSGNRTQPVAQKQPNAFGLYDMAGNVWEWCEDLDGSSRVIRGGAWSFAAPFTKGAYRNYFNPVYCFNSIGFRVVKGVHVMIDEAFFEATKGRRRGFFCLNPHRPL
jgi:formylglycine-generating enzyme required for sulfatase activity